jgi:hypothetical protein
VPRKCQADPEFGACVECSTAARSLSATRLSSAAFYGSSRRPTFRSGCVVNGYKVDFHSPDLGLVVETDGLRYHRTPPLRFTHAQVRFEPEYVAAILAEIAHRLVR